MLELYVFASAEHQQAVLVARLDNLGKGASGRGGAEHAADVRSGIARLVLIALFSCAAPLVRRRDFLCADRHSTSRGVDKHFTQNRTLPAFWTVSFAFVQHCPQNGHGLVTTKFTRRRHLCVQLKRKNKRCLDGNRRRSAAPPRRKISTGIEADRVKFSCSPVFFADAYCPACDAMHRWFAREAWVEDPHRTSPRRRDSAAEEREMNETSTPRAANGARCNSSRRDTMDAAADTLRDEIPSSFVDCSTSRSRAPRTCTTRWPPSSSTRPRRSRRRCPARTRGSAEYRVKLMEMARAEREYGVRSRARACSRRSRRQKLLELTLRISASSSNSRRRSSRSFRADAEGRDRDHRADPPRA